MAAFWIIGVVSLVITGVVAQRENETDISFNLDEYRFDPNRAPADSVKRIEVPRDTYTNSRYVYGDERDSYGTYSPQYEYKPYEGDCNSVVYEEYGRYLANFKGEWYDNEKYPPPTYEQGSFEDEYVQEYTYTEIKPGREYPTYDPNVDIPESQTNSKKGCCNRFSRKKLPKRSDFPRSGDGSVPRGRVRKEYRQLSDDERNSLHDAFNCLKDNGQYNVMLDQHKQIISPYAHNGASFLPWHREYLFRLENALYECNYTGPGLPYFDSTLDQQLPNPAHSAAWTAPYLGNINGVVNIGPFTGWSSTPACTFIDPFLFRNGLQGVFGQCLLMSDFDVEYVFTKDCFRDITCNTDCKFETDHAGVHNFVGGHMGNPTCAPSDPFFFMHHAFIDCIWETFRQEHQKSPIESEYPSQSAGDNVGTPPGGAWSPNGFEWNAPMMPFAGLLNGHGICSWYEKYYTCMDRPIQCKIEADCGGKILWCDNGRCRAKVKIGGDCTGLPDAACDDYGCGNPQVAACNPATNLCHCPFIGKKK